MYKYLDKLSEVGIFKFNFLIYYPYDFKTVISYNLTEFSAERIGNLCSGNIENAVSAVKYVVPSVD